MFIIFGTVESHFREIVYSLFVQSPQQLIETIRLNKGIRLLLDEVKIYEAAIKVGYRNTRSFRRAFTKRFDLNPGQFKKELKHKYNNKDSVRKKIKTSFGSNIY